MIDGVPLPLFYLLSVLISFISVFVKIFQTKNVMGDHKRLAFLTAYGVAVLDVATIGIVVLGGWPIALTSGTGAAFGVVTAMATHDRMFAGKGLS